MTLERTAPTIFACRGGPLDYCRDPNRLTSNMPLAHFVRGPAPKELSVGKPDLEAAQGHGLTAVPAAGKRLPQRAMQLSKGRGSPGCMYPQKDTPSLSADEFWLQVLCLRGEGAGMFRAKVGEGRK